MKKIFITSTMFSRNNGPANFAMNLYEYYKNNHLIYFLTPDVDYPQNNILKTKMVFSKILKPISMLMMGIDFFITLRKVKFDTVIWNFSVLAWFSMMFGSNKHKNIVFVNDPLSLDLNYEFSYNFLRLYIFRIFEKYSCRKANKVITNSYVIKRKLIENYNISKDNIYVLYKGVNFKQIVKTKQNFKIDPKNLIQIAFVKSNYKVGGLEKLCKALSQITNKKFQINIFGPNYIEKKLYKFSNVKLNLSKKVSKDDLFKSIINSDVFCVPNSVEAYGQANIEAIALQLPTIILPVDYQLYLHDESYCYIPKRDNINSLTKTFLEIFSLSESQREFKAKLGRNHMEKLYSIENSLQNFDKIISTN